MFNNKEMVVCVHCGEWFDLYTGYDSLKWYPKDVICRSCHDEEVQEVELEKLEVVVEQNANTPKTT